MFHLWMKTRFLSGKIKFLDSFCFFNWLTDFCPFLNSRSMQKLNYNDKTLIFINKFKFFFNFLQFFLLLFIIFSINFFFVNNQWMHWHLVMQKYRTLLSFSYVVIIMIIIICNSYVYLCIIYNVASERSFLTWFRSRNFVPCIFNFFLYRAR